MYQGYDSQNLNISKDIISASNEVVQAYADARSMENGAFTNSKRFDTLRDSKEFQVAKQAE